ncbi:sigma 54-interacting transcriptional regulator [Flavonifractor sp. AGMB03687]|uniref:sigma-54 interaction domain-containing protein n=1 Tax=Flavonifractor sp. AGMB03687 TaxID=2785133 RepID=UPI001AE089EA|nr:sigma 54-interacting transcriptional regulator [Flavonifractor sp. AGMB03687]
MDKSQFDRLVDSGVLDQILDTSYDGFTYTDETGTIAYVNRAYCEMTGFSEESILGRSIYDLIQLGRPLARMSIKVFETRQPITELVRYRADTNQEIMVTVLPFYEKGTDTFRGIVANLRDMTDLTELRRELELSYLRYDEVVKQHEEANQKLHQRLEELQVMLKDCDIVGESRQMRGLAELAYRIGSVQSTVLITGESGVGKDVFCRMVHKFSGPDKPFVKISCGAIPDNLLESELFGYEAGAFTGANKHGKPGIFELGDGGTVFLDEIGELPLQLQVKLLTVLQDRTFFRLGGVKALPMNARIIAATNRDLKEEVAAGRFRQDLYYRLNVIPVHIPPLRERKEDIIPLAAHALERLAHTNGVRKVLDVRVQRIFTNYAWPGNVRELNNVVERMYVFCPGDVLTVDYLPRELASESEPAVTLDSAHTLKETMERLEASVLLSHLDEERTLNEIAAGLGISVSTLIRKLSRYHLPRRYRRSDREEET